MAEPEAKRRRTEEPEAEEDANATDEGAGVLGELTVYVLLDVLALLSAEELAYVRAASRYMCAMVDWMRTAKKRGTRLTKPWFAVVHGMARAKEALAARPYRPPWHECVPCAAAARLGNMEVLAYLYDAGCPLDEASCAGAAHRGDLAMLMWLRERGCPWTFHTFSRAAAEGRLEVLKWMHANDCPRNDWACIRAAASGQLETLQWLRSIGCPWNMFPWDVCVCKAAAASRQWAVLDWAHAGDVSSWPCASNPCAYTRTRLRVARRANE
jgi:hypothetical protein